MYEKIFEFETEEPITPVSTDQSVISPVEGEVDTDGVVLERQDSSFTAEQLEAVRAKFYRSVF